MLSSFAGILSFSFVCSCDKIDDKIDLMKDNEVFESLLKHDANINAQDNYGWSILHWATRCELDSLSTAE